MGGSWILCARPKPHRLRPRGREARRLSPDRCELKALPGIGSYTAAAVAAIAFGEKAPAIDTNVERVVSRWLGLCEPRRSRIESHLLGLMDEHHPGDVVQALMDVGATIC